MATITTETLRNGLVLAVEEQPENRGAAMALLVPAGATTDPEELLGSAAVLEHWLWKGAGRLDARAFAEALDDLGVRRGSQTGVEYTTFSAALLPEVLPRALELFSLLFLAPRLEDETFDAARRAVEEELAALEEKYGDQRRVAEVVTGLRSRLEAALERTGMDDRAVPELAVSMAELPTIDCAPEEGFIVSGINGIYTVDEVLKLIPGDPMENRLRLKGLLDRGLLRFKQPPSTD